MLRISRCIDENLFAFASKENTKILELNDDNTMDVKRILKIGTKDIRNGMTDVAWNPINKNIIATATLYNSQILYWDVSKIHGKGGGGKVTPSKIGAHRQLINRISWSHTNEKLLASCSQDGDIKIWDTNNLYSKDCSDSNINPVLCIHTREKIRDCKFCPGDDKLLLSSDDDGKIKLWDTRKPETQINSFIYHTNSVLTIDWHPYKKNVFCSGGSDKLLCIWSKTFPKEPKIVYNSSESINFVKWFEPNPNYILSSYQTGNFFSLWNTDILNIPEYLFPGIKVTINSFSWDVEGKRILCFLKDGNYVIKYLDEGIRFFDTIHCSCVKFEDWNFLNSYSEPTPERKPFNENIYQNPLEKAFSNKYVFEDKKDCSFNIINCNKGNFEFDLSNLSDNLGRSHLSNYENLEAFYISNIEEMRSTFSNYYFILSDKLYKNVIFRNKQFTEKIKLAIKKNIEYATRKNYNTHIETWKSLEFLVNLSQFSLYDKVIASRTSNEKYSDFLKGEMMFFKIIEYRVLAIIDFVNEQNNDFLLATFISYLFHFLFEQDEDIQKKLEMIEKSCINYLEENKCFKEKKLLKKFGFVDPKKNMNVDNRGKFWFYCSCSSKIRDPKDNICQCDKKVKCAKCHTNLSNIVEWCSICGHYGHEKEISEWFSQNYTCPSGCGHKCRR